jgi:hypothetical protein
VVGALRHLRARAARYALAVAVCQLAVLLSATVVLTASTSGASTIAADEECRCDHSAAVMCPMHKRSTRPLPPDAPRWCAGVDETAYAVLPTLGVLGLPERDTQTISLTFESLVPAARAGAIHPLATPPDSPPPRA